MDRKARVAKRPRTTRSFHSAKTQSRRGSNVSLQRIAGHSGVEDTEHDFEQAVLNETREVLVELFDLLEEYGPAWYTDTHRSRALAAIRALQGS
jgi:hypothetical protein